MVELAAVRVRGRVSVEQFHQLVRPDAPDEPAATRGARLQRRRPLRPADLRPRSGPSSGPSSATICWWRTTASSSTSRCCAGWPPGCPGSTSWSSSTPCRSRARCWTRAPGWRTWPTASGCRRAARTTRSTMRARWPACSGTWASCKLARARRSALVHLLGWLGPGARAGRTRGARPPEERLLRELTLPAALGRYGDCLEVYAEERRARAGAPVGGGADRATGRRAG